MINGATDQVALLAAAWIVVLAREVHAAAWTLPVERGWLPWCTLEIAMMTRASSPEMAQEKP